MDTTAMAPEASPLSDSEEAIERASDCLALLAATIRGVLNTGDGLTTPEARGALALLTGVQADLECATTSLQSLASRKATPATA